jgi:hypothetical protein
MDIYYNLINNYFNQIFKYFFNKDKLKSLYLKKYIENYKNSIKFKKLSLKYTNQKWDIISKKFIWNSSFQKFTNIRYHTNNFNNLEKSKLSYLKKYIENYKNSIKIKKLSLNYTNQRGDDIKKNFILNSFVKNNN